MKFIGSLRVFFGLLAFSPVLSVSGQSWTNRYNGPGNYADTADNLLVVDPSGSSYVAGTASALEGNLDNVVIKYSAAGVPLWTNIYTGAGNGSFALTYLARGMNSNIYMATGS